MDDNFIYKIPVLVPPSGLADWNFAIDLDLDFAKRARERHLDLDFYDYLNKQGNDIINNFEGLKAEPGNRPYKFFRNSFLLLFIDGLGDSSNLGLETGYINYFSQKEWKTKKLENFSFHDIRCSSDKVIYTPHNVETSENAQCLLNLWLNWANSTKIFLKSYF